MERAAGGRKTKHQAAWTKLIVRIVFNDLAFGHCFSNFLHADPAKESLVNRMFRKLKLTFFDLLPDSIED